MATRLADNPLLKKTQAGDFGVLSISVASIQPSPHQSRRHFDETAIDELARSIQQIGLIQPIKVVKEGDAFRLVYGERRLRALNKLGVQQLLWDSRTKFATLPSDGPSTDLALQTLTENIMRNDLSPIEEADAYINIQSSNHLETQQDVAELLGIDKRRVSEKVSLLRLPDSIKDQMAAHSEFTFRHARALLRLADEPAQMALFKKAIDEGLSVAQMERIVDEKLFQVPAQPKVVVRASSPKARLLRRFRRSAWQVVDTLKALSTADEATRREWQRRFAGPSGLVRELRALLDQCEAPATAQAQPPKVVGATAADEAGDEMRPAE